MKKLISVILVLCMSVTAGIFLFISCGVNPGVVQPSSTQSSSSNSRGSRGERGARGSRGRSGSSGGSGSDGSDGSAGFPGACYPTYRDWQSGSTIDFSFTNASNYGDEHKEITEKDPPANNATKNIIITNLDRYILCHENRSSITKIDGRGNNQFQTTSTGDSIGGILDLLGKNLTGGNKKYILEHLGVDGYECQASTGICVLKRSNGEHVEIYLNTATQDTGASISTSCPYDDTQKTALIVDIHPRRTQNDLYEKIGNTEYSLSEGQAALLEYLQCHTNAETITDIYASDTWIFVENSQESIDEILGTESLTALGISVSSNTAQKRVKKTTDCATPGHGFCCYQDTWTISSNSNRYTFTGRSAILNIHAPCDPPSD